MHHRITDKGIKIMIQDGASNIIQQQLQAVSQSFNHFWRNYLQKRGISPVLHPFNALRHGAVGLQVVQVERLFAGAQNAGNGRAVAHGEADLHVDALRCPPVYVRGQQPVVLAGLEHVAHLVRPDGVEVLVITADLLPLGIVGMRGRRREESRRKGGEVKMINGFTEI